MNGRISRLQPGECQELIKMAEGEGELVLSVERLRGLIGREENGESFSALNRRVLRPAQAELEERCDTYFTYAVEQDGPRPVRVQLAVHRRDSSGRPSSPRQSASEESSAEETSS